MSKNAGTLDKEKLIVDVSILQLASSGYRFVTRREINELARVLGEKAEVVELTYIRALRSGTRLPLILVGCGFKK